MISFRNISHKDISKVSNLRMLLLNNPNSHYGSNNVEELNNIKNAFCDWLKINIENTNTNIVISMNDEGVLTSMGIGIIDNRAPIKGALSGKVWWISSLIVHPDFQNNGLGKETLAYLIEWFSEKSVNKITLQSTEHGEKLYKKMGFNKSIENTFIKEC